MIEVKRDLNWTHAILEARWLPPNHGGQRCEALLPIEQELLITEDPGVLLDREIPGRHLKIGFPDKNCSRWVAAVQRVEEVADPRCRPNVSALKFGESELSLVNHVNEFADADVNLRHLPSTPSW